MWHRIGIVALVVTGTLISGLIGCAGVGGFNVTRGSGNVISQARDVSGFSTVVLAGVGDLTITQDDTERLTIQAEDNLLPLIKTTVKDNILTIGLNDGVLSGGLAPTKPIQYALQVKSLEAVQLSGAGNVTATALKSQALELSMSGAGSMNVSGIDAQELTTTTTGAGSVTVAGKAVKADTSLSGLGSYTAGDLQSNDVSVTISGAGSATVWAADTLTVRISGAGSVSYYGSPQVTKNISGLGSIKQLGNK